MINDQDQWEIAETSTVKFAPSLVISPCRAVRILGQQSKSDDPPAARLDIVMGVPEEFLLTELWYCQNHKRNPQFSEIVEVLLAQPVYSHLAKVERICPAMGITPIPACDLLDVGPIYDVSSFEQYFAPTCWLYEKSSELVHERCVAKRTDFPLEMVLLTPQRNEIPQACYNVTYMLFPSANWESKAKKMRRKGGSYSIFEKYVVMPYTGELQRNRIPEGWKSIMSDLDVPQNIPYRIRRNLVTEMSGATVDDQISEKKDSHEASEDQAEEAADEKDKAKAEVRPLVSAAFSFSSEDTEFDEETGEFASMKLRCPLCGPTKRDPHAPLFHADSTYSISYHMQRVHSFLVCRSSKGYTDQQLIAGRAIQTSFSWLNRERENVGTHKERRLERSGSTMTAVITPMVLSNTELDLKGKAELLPMVYMAHNVKLLVRPEHPITAYAMTYKGEAAKRPPLCSDLLHEWAMGLVTGNPMALTKMDPLSSPDLLFPMPDRSPPLCHITPSDVKASVKLLLRPNEKSENADKLISAWEALINLFFAMAQIMRLCADYEQIIKSPFASYHQHALVSPDTLSLSIPDKLQDKEDEYNPPKSIHGLFSNHSEAHLTAEEWGKEIHACSISKLARQQEMTYHCQYTTASTDERLKRLKKLDNVTCGLASVVRLTTPAMDLIADTGVEPEDLGRGITRNQQVVMPYYAAYQQVRKSVVARSNMGPVGTLRDGLPIGKGF